MHMLFEDFSKSFLEKKKQKQYLKFDFKIFLIKNILFHTERTHNLRWNEYVFT